MPLKFLGKIFKRLGKLFKRASTELTPTQLIIISMEVSQAKDYKDKVRLVLDRLRPYANVADLMYIGFVDLFIDKIKDGKVSWTDALYLVDYLERNIEKPKA
jgi:hypothetical protein